MRSLYQKDVIQNPYKISPFQQRSRLKSLKQLRQIPFTDPFGENKTSQQYILQILQRKLVQDNSKQENEEAILELNDFTKKKSLRFSSKHTQKEEQQKKLIELRQRNKLFQYFQELYKKEVPEEKVQREKVNFCQKQFEQMKNKVMDKIQANTIRLKELQQSLKEKYLQLHEYHQQSKELSTKVKQQKKARQLFESQQQSKKLRLDRQISQIEPPRTNSPSHSMTMSLRPPSLKEKLFILQETISFIKKEISKLEEEIEAINLREFSIEEEWVIFLKIFLNSEYYLGDGCERVLVELKKMKAKLGIDDLMTQVLDDASKKYVVWYYGRIERIQRNDAKQYSKHNFQSNFSDLPSQFNTLSIDYHQYRPRIRSNIEMKSLVKNANLKEIYSNTKQAMINLLKHDSFRNNLQTKFTQKQPSFLPKIVTRKHSVQKNSRVTTVIHEEQANEKNDKNSIEENKRQQVNRINHIYFGNSQEMEQKGKIMKRILFGFGVK